MTPQELQAAVTLIESAARLLPALAEDVAAIFAQHYGRANLEDVRLQVASNLSRERTNAGQL